ncbi:adenine deaminase [Chitinophaga ginsengisegetis]|uniref:adenine deaminase n=1 Tax=Chitinophaga ginsengisegetis TaxID=393003 RepID=UPI000DB9B595|nr:adenine deaminase [Chitinophaga ginsengisegetis]MDR6570304.1 adenine deaminase [Chitinophaga ginsengisegetis]MDR6650038.1 adenine deaminase [Chitinophaga ginsengisegetis]MDR6656321.1 adenine deaminase [Chitinophaga ginsengisegetis]
MNTFQFSGNLVDILQQEIYPATIHITDGYINRIERNNNQYTTYLLPGFTDAHVHVESSMLIPSEFARLAVVHGTIATVSDPHEIANVMGVKGVEYMLENGKKVPFRFNFGAPSCVPATVFETAGAVVTVADIEALLQRDDIRYLTEMMNFPGVLHKDPEVLSKIAAAQKAGKPVDGHAPGLRGETAAAYIAAGISTDHECFTIEEALDKLQYGMHILIREGSAAKNFEALYPLLHDHASHIMFCSDDKHPDNLVEGHINLLVKRALAYGVDLFKVLRAACINPVLHYKLDNGLLRVNDPADFIVIDDLQNFNILATYINGVKVAENGHTLIPSIPSSPVNNFIADPVTADDFRIPVSDSNAKEITVKVIGAMDGQLITNALTAVLPVVNGAIESNPQQDILKLVVVNRYKKAPPAVAFIHGFGLQHGAIASSVAHDSHNIIAVGTDDESLAAAINSVIAAQGGISAVGNNNVQELPLPVAGLMSNLDGYTIAARYSALDKAAKELGSTLASPFMTLSFMALLVIPHLKLSDLGLFDGDSFQFTTTH